MRKILIGAVLALATVAHAATKVPVQMLDTTGSSSGQAIVSGGPSGAASWGSVSLGGLAPVAANTVLANASGSTATPAAFAMPSCSGSNNALRWTSGTGFTCAGSIALTSIGLNQFASTTSAQLAGMISDETGSGALVFATNPTLGGATFTGDVMFTAAIAPSSTAGIRGTTTNDSASTGSVGEYVQSSVTGVVLTSGANANIASISLSAGDWDVDGLILFVPASTTTVSSLALGTSVVSGAFGGLGSLASYGLSFSTGAAQRLMTPRQRISLASSGAVYLVGQAAFGVSTMTADGFIRARRVR
ncbi:hypothetical protein [Burkholderia vietnamiensis]|uniref:hypothetical protein n=1 Tax=Burkholderia vietnamiensis TaxID=60552 RepID=UPI001CF42D65|nr:hypothetical protein [Burkholderia vietnamiensis]MCA7984192.1 hypothetical protein [Burkholderia vietnamiensis]